VAGNLVVSQVGDGIAELSNAATPVFLKEFTLAAGQTTPVQIIALPTTVSDGNYRLTNSGVAASEGALTRSVDGRYLTLTGYDAEPGTGNIAGSTNVSRVVGRIDWTGAIDTTTALSAYSGNNIRSAVSTDGVDLWITGPQPGTDGVRYTALGCTGDGSIQLAGVNSRVANIFNGQLYISSGSSGYYGISAVGSGLPITKGQTATVLPGTGISGAGDASPFDFYFADANTLYVADDRAPSSGGGIQKWTFNGASWSLAYVLAGELTAVGVRGLTGTTADGVTTLYATTAESVSRLVSVADTGAGSAFVTLATAPANTAFRGVDFAPAPEWADFCANCDANGDGLINGADVMIFAACRTAVGAPAADACQQFDLDGDGDVDQCDFGRFQLCLGLFAPPANPLISELMAINDTTLQDEDGDYSDWIEIYNPGPPPLELDGWYLTDSAGNRTKWRFPPVDIAPHGYLVVFASDKNRAEAGRPLHTNFKLDGDGEYLALVRPDGFTVAFQFAPKYPSQTGDISYGLEMESVADALIPEAAACRATVPTGGPLTLDWTQVGFDDSSWLAGTTAVGYERGSGYETLIGTDVGVQMYGVTATALVRVPFAVANPTEYTGLTLRMRYDDGFVAYLNGHLLASANAPDTLDWDSAAPADHPDDQALAAVDFDVTDKLGWLVRGRNVLAIQGLNHGTGSSDFLILPELYATRTAVAQPFSAQYFTVPTPGWANGLLAPNVGPAISEARHSPALPAANQAIMVTARVTPVLGPVASVALYYRVMYGSEVAVTMLDDGVHNDGAAGDGVYGATVPGSASTPGQMVRWYISAADTKARISRWPPYASPLNSPQYLGTVVADPAVTSQLPILQWFVQDTAAAETDSGTRASVYHLGQFYDNIKVHLRGNTSTYWPKKHLKFNFNSGEKFLFAADQAKVDEFNLNSTYSDKSYIRQVLSWGTYQDAGAAGSLSFPMRVQQNGQFYSVAIFVEEPEEELLTRQGLDPEGALYKLECQLDYVNSGVAEKKTREGEGLEDIQALVAGLKLTGTARKNYLFDNVDIPACINYVAATTLMHDNDHVAKNYYLYRDTNGSGEWQMLPWDKDLTFGRNFTLAGGVLNDTMWADQDHPAGYPAYVGPSHPLFGDSDHQKADNLWNRLIDALSDTPEIRAMYVRRLRTLMDEQLQPPGTPTAQLKYEARIDELVSQMQADVALDRAKWAAHGIYYGTDQDFATAIGILKTEYLAVRRTHLFNTHGPSGDGLIPAAQATSPSPTISFGTIEDSPASGIQDEEYVELVNANGFAVDITGWQFQVYDDTNGTFETKHTFRPGTVLRAGSSLYLTPNTVAFRARATSPHGGEGRLIQGNYHHHIAPGETLRLVDAAGAEKAIVTIGG
jgi:hypothetical protein